MEITFPGAEYNISHPDWHDIHVNGTYVGSYAMAVEDGCVCGHSGMRWAADVTLDHVGDDDTPELFCASTEAILRARIRDYIETNANP